MTKKVLTEERASELRRYFAPVTAECGCMYLGSDRAEVCEKHEAKPETPVAWPTVKGTVGDFQIDIVRCAITTTELGLAGYVEAKLPDGRVLRFAGRWDNVYNQTEEKPAQIAELLWINDEFVPCDDEASHLIEIGDDGVRLEDIATAAAIAHAEQVQRPQEKIAEALLSRGKAV